MQLTGSPGKESGFLRRTEEAQVGGFLLSENGLIESEERRIGKSHRMVGFKLGLRLQGGGCQGSPLMQNIAGAVYKAWKGGSGLGLYFWFGSCWRIPGEILRATIVKEGQSLRTLGASEEC